MPSGMAQRQSFLLPESAHHRLGLGPELALRGEALCRPLLCRLGRNQAWLTGGSSKYVLNEQQDSATWWCHGPHWLPCSRYTPGILLPGPSC